MGQATSSGLKRKLSIASARRRSSDAAFPAGPAELARQASNLPLLAFPEGEGFSGDPHEEVGDLSPPLAGTPKKVTRPADNLALLFLQLLEYMQTSKLKIMLASARENLCS